MALCPSSLDHHSSKEWAFPPLPPLPIVTAGMPLAIGILELVDPRVRKGFAPNAEVAARVL
jgi:hypothetical protein